MLGTVHVSWHPDTEYEVPAEVHTVYLTVPVYPLAHVTPEGENPVCVAIPATLAKL